jgi:hypothetical protein
VALSFEGRPDIFSIAPRLRSLIVKGVCMPSISLVLPWAQLTSYCATCTSLDHIAVLRLCPNLLSADLTFTTPPQPASDVIVGTVPLLRTLRLSDAAFLACLSLPLLQDVVVGASDETADALLPPLLAFLRRETPPLTSVCLHSGTLAPKTLAAILAEKPAIHTLRFRIHRVDTAAIDALVAQLEATPNNVVLAPNLATLPFHPYAPLASGFWHQAHRVAHVEVCPGRGEHSGEA